MSKVSSQPEPLVPPRRRNAKNLVRILAFSDWRVPDYEDLLKLAERSPGCDIVLYGGDDLDRVIEAREVVEKITCLTSAKKFLFVAGNDDSPHDRRALAATDFAHDLHAEPFFYQDFAFIGLEGTTDGMGFIQHSESQVTEVLEGHLQTIRKRYGRKKPVTVLVSHAPPRGVLDMAMRHSERPGARSIGSTSLRDFLEENRVPVTICGHVHLFGARQERLPNKNLVINIASHDSRGAEGRFSVIDLDRSGHAEVSFHTTHVLLHDHELGRLQHVGMTKVRRLLQNGIQSLADVTEENRPRLRIPGCGDRHINIWIRQSELIRGGFVGIEILEYDRMAFLEDKRFVVWDIETDLKQTHIWLIGALDTLTGERRQFFNPDDESDCAKGFVEWMAGRASATPVSFSCTRFDPRTLRKSLERHGILDAVNICERDVDLGNRLLYSCAHTYPTSKVKDLAHHLGYRFRHPNLDGMAVGAMFSRYLNTGRGPGRWKPYLEYNEDDVLATLLILEKVKEARARGETPRHKRRRRPPQRGAGRL
ncbi:MAG TPA: ribonuclease H-like domain-containing protein [Pyrinomonadaceae bacterium]